MDGVRLPPESPDVLEALAGAGTTEDLDAIVRSEPVCLEAWARLGDEAYMQGRDVAAYAYFRVGYHRGLDRLRAAGWRPDLEVPWDHDENRGFLRSLHGLMRAAAAIGEGVEARRCREFLLQLDPTDQLGVGAIQPKDLSRRLDP